MVIGAIARTIGGDELISTKRITDDTNELYILNI